MSSSPQTASTPTLSVTGERVFEDHSGSLQDYVSFRAHQDTYRFIGRHVADKTVLDLGCGTGYGSSLLAVAGARVTAVDVAPDALAYAKSKYGDKGIVFDRIVPGSPLAFEDSSFDVVVSAQVIEHVYDIPQYLGEINRVLKPDGKAFVVTPDRTHRLFSFQRPWNQFHLTEWDAKSYWDCLAPHIDVQDVVKMGSEDALLNVELRRTKRLRLTNLPFTLPIMPDAMRRSCMKVVMGAGRALKGILGSGKRKSESQPAVAPAEKPRHPNLQFCYGADVPRSINLIGILRKKVP